MFILTLLVLHAYAVCTHRCLRSSVAVPHVVGTWDTKSPRSVYHCPRDVFTRVALLTVAGRFSNNLSTLHVSVCILWAEMFSNLLVPTSYAPTAQHICDIPLPKYASVTSCSQYCTVPCCRRRRRADQTVHRCINYRSAEPPVVHRLRYVQTLDLVPREGSTTSRISTV